MAQSLKNLSADVGNAGDASLIPGSGRSLEKEMATHPCILAWRIPWTEKPVGLQSRGSQGVRTGQLDMLLVPGLGATLPLLQIYVTVFLGLFQILVFTCA